MDDWMSLCGASFFGFATGAVLVRSMMTNRSDEREDSAIAAKHALAIKEYKKARERGERSERPPPPRSHERRWG
jgi:hypothetical protein